jgi:hypothetical protein
MGSKLERPDVGRFAGLIKAREAALVLGGGFAAVGVADGRTAGQQGHRLRGAAVVLQRAKAGIDRWLAEVSARSNAARKTARACSSSWLMEASLAQRLYQLLASLKVRRMQ